jgi:hypothetical protein
MSVVETRRREVHSNEERFTRTFIFSFLFKKMEQAGLSEILTSYLFRLNNKLGHDELFTHNVTMSQIM